MVNIMFCMQSSAEINLKRSKNILSLWWWCPIFPYAHIYFSSIIHSLMSRHANWKLCIAMCIFQSYWLKCIFAAVIWHFSEIPVTKSFSRKFKTATTASSRIWKDAFNSHFTDVSLMITSMILYHMCGENWHEWCENSALFPVTCLPIMYNQQRPMDV